MIAYANQESIPYLKKDKHLSSLKLQQKIADKEMMIAQVRDTIVGWLRFNFFWDEIPFINMLYIEEPHREQGHGKALLRFWESEMKKQGHSKLMTSSQSDESGQHFFRKNGYRDTGALLLPDEPLEIFFIKEI